MKKTFNSILLDTFLIDDIDDIAIVNGLLLAIGNFDGTNNFSVYLFLNEIRM